jgi:hypothetical protein
VVPLL